MISKFKNIFNALERQPDLKSVWQVTTQRPSQRNGFSKGVSLGLVSVF